MTVEQGQEPEAQVPEGTEPEVQETEVEEIPEDAFEGLPEVPEDGDMLPRSVVEETRREAARRRVALRELEQHIENAGGQDGLTDLIDLRNRLQDESGEGAVQVFFALADKLGVGIDQLSKLFESGDDPAASSEPELDDELLDEPLTRRQLEDILHERVLNPMQKNQEEQTLQAAEDAVTGTLSELKVPEEDWPAVLGIAERLVDENETDPAKLRDAVTQAHGKFEARVQAAAQAFAKEKAQQAGSGGALKGGTPASGTKAPEPRSVEEVIRRRVATENALGQTASERAAARAAE